MSQMNCAKAPDPTPMLAGGLPEHVHHLSLRTCGSTASGGRRSSRLRTRSRLDRSGCLSRAVGVVWRWPLEQMATAVNDLSGLPVKIGSK